MQAEQEAVEDYVIDKFNVTNKRANSTKRKTIYIADLQMFKCTWHSQHLLMGAVL